jgi:serine protease Do
VYHSANAFGIRAAESQHMKKFSRQLNWTIAATLLSVGSLGTVWGVKESVSADSVPKSKQELVGTSKAFNEIARKAVPAVVSISVIKRASPLDDEDEGLRGAPFDHHEAPPMRGGEEGGGRAVGVGSGIFIRKDGMILTNHHVIENAERITVTLDDKHKRSAKLIGDDSKTDLAVIQLNPPKDNDSPREFQTIEFGDSDAINVGDWAVAVGSPFGLNRSVTSGIVSAKGRAQMGILDIEDFIQTDAAINPGSSGGPLLNVDGKMIGVNTAIFSQGGGFVGIGFAIPSKIAKEVSEQLMTKGHMTRGYIGLSAQDMDPQLGRYFSVPKNEHGEPAGALVSDVQPNGPAQKASIQPGDVVLKYGDQSVSGASQLKSLVGKTPAGSVVKLELIHSGKNEVRDVQILQQPGDKKTTVQQAGQVASSNPSSPNLGLTVDDVPAEISHFLGMPQSAGALVINVSPGSPAFDSGLMPGDIILKAGQTEVFGAKQFKKLARQQSKELTVLYVQRGPDERVFVPVNGSSRG